MLFGAEPPLYSKPPGYVAPQTGAPHQGPSSNPYAGYPQQPQPQVQPLPSIQQQQQLGGYPNPSVAAPRPQADPGLASHSIWGAAYAAATAGGMRPPDAAAAANAAAATAGPSSGPGYGMQQSPPPPPPVDPKQQQTEELEANFQVRLRHAYQYAECFVRHGQCILLVFLCGRLQLSGSIHSEQAQAQDVLACWLVLVGLLVVAVLRCGHNCLTNPNTVLLLFICQQQSDLRSRLCLYQLHNLLAGPSCMQPGHSLAIVPFFAAGACQQSPCWSASSRAGSIQQACSRRNGPAARGAA